METLLIVVVDVSEERARPLEERLSQDFDCLFVGDAEAAIQAVRRHQPAAVVVDFPFPTADRRTLTAALKDDPETAGVPVIAYSAWDFGNTRRKARELGCATFVARSEGPDGVAAALDTALSVRKAS